MQQTTRDWRYWIRLLVAAIVALILSAAAAVVGVSYQQAMGYLHPQRSIASGDLLRANGIEFQDIELITEDGIKLAAWYTPPKNGAVMLL